MTDCKPELMREKDPSKIKMTLCGLEKSNGRCSVSSRVMLLGSAPAASMSSLALTFGASIKSVNLIRFVSDTAAFIYSTNGSPIYLYVQDNGTWHLQYSRAMPPPIVY